MTKDTQVVRSTETENEVELGYTKNSRRVHNKSLRKVILVTVGALLVLVAGGWFLLRDNGSGSGVGSGVSGGGSSGNRGILYSTGYLEENGQIRNVSIAHTALWTGFVVRLESINFDYSAYTREMTNMLYAGIPEPLRRMVWGRIFDNLRHYGSLLRANPTDSEAGNEEQIDRDLNRTMLQHIRFYDTPSNSPIKQSLRRILVNYARWDPEIGYCQSMASPVAFLLTYFDAEKAEEYYFKFMVSLNWRNIYNDEFRGLRDMVFIQEQLMRNELPALLAYFNDNGISTLSYTTAMYLTWFLEGDLNLAARIWDLFPIYQFDPMKLFPRVVVALLKVHETEFYEMESDEALIFAIRMLKNNTDPEEFIASIKTIN